MSGHLAVRLGNDQVATISESRGTTVLKYEESYAKRANAIPLSLSLPIGGRAHRGARVDRFLDNLLPDNSDVRDSWARAAKLTSTQPIDLLTQYGRDTAGAFTYHGEQEDVEVAPLALSSTAIATMLHALRNDSSAWHGAGSFGKFSLAGAQAKTSLAYDGIDWYKTSGPIPSTHIFKIALSKFPDSDLIEHITMATARRVGISAAQTWIGSFETERALVVERFDRQPASGLKTQRIHQEDALQGMGRSRLEKYQEEGGPRPEEIIEILDSTQSEWAATSNRLDYLKQLAFHWLVCGTDAHAKNYSIFLIPGEHLLTPMYDASSYLPYIDSPADTLPTAIARVKLSANIATSYEVGSTGAFEWSGIARKARLGSFDIVQWMRGTADSIRVQMVDECDRVQQAHPSAYVQLLRERIDVRVDQVLSGLS